MLVEWKEDINVVFHRGSCLKADYSINPIMWRLSQILLWPLTFLLFLLSSHSLSIEAYGMLKEADKKGVVLGPAPYDHLVRALLAEGSINDAMVVKEM